MNIKKEDAQSSDNSPFRRFERFAKGLINVSKKEVEALQAKYRKASH